jgi:uncharacterized protein
MHPKGIAALNRSCGVRLVCAYSFNLPSPTVRGFSIKRAERLGQSHNKFQDEPMKETGKINYIELPARDLQATKAFFSAAFGWSFVDYGPQYMAIENAGLDGGFFQSDKVATTENGSVLVVLYSAALEESVEKVKSAGGQIVLDIFPFPGGRRFHFTDPNGNEYAVWSEPEA